MGIYVSIPNPLNRKNPIHLPSGHLSLQNCNSLILHKAPH